MKNSFRFCRYHVLYLLTISIFFSALSASADIVTNLIQSFPAADGKLALLVHLLDTDTSNHLAGSLTIFDKDNNKIVDEPHLGGYADYIITHFTGKRLLQRTPEGVASNQFKFILYKLTRKGLVRMNEQVVTDSFMGYIHKSYISIMQTPSGSHGCTVFNASFKKLLYSIPMLPGPLYDSWGNGVMVRVFTSNAVETITYYKKGTILATHVLPALSNGFYNIRQDSKGGLLYWISIGPMNSYTNLPVTYLTAKGQKKPDNASLQDAAVYWRVNSWDGKYLYIHNPGTDSNIVYKLTKKADKLGDVIVSNRVNTLVDKSKVYFFINDGCGYGIVEYDRKLSKKKWTDPCTPGSLVYMGNGVFKRQHSVDNGTTGLDVTITIFTRRKTIATHTYLQPY
jgi:hypothetical protein